MRYQQHISLFFIILLFCEVSQILSVNAYYLGYEDFSGTISNSQTLSLSNSESPYGSDSNMYAFNGSINFVDLPYGDVESYLTTLAPQEHNIINETFLTFENESITTKALNYYQPSTTDGYVALYSYFEHSGDINCSMMFIPHSRCTIEMRLYSSSNYTRFWVRNYGTYLTAQIILSNGTTSILPIISYLSGPIYFSSYYNASNMELKMKYKTFEGEASISTISDKRFDAFDQITNFLNDYNDGYANISILTYDCNIPLTYKTVSESYNFGVDNSFSNERILQIYQLYQQSYHSFDYELFDIPGDFPGDVDNPLNIPYINSKTWNTQYEYCEVNSFTNNYSQTLMQGVNVSMPNDFILFEDSGTTFDYDYDTWNGTLESDSLTHFCGFSKYSEYFNDTESIEFNIEYTTGTLDTYIELYDSTTMNNIKIYFKSVGGPGGGFGYYELGVWQNVASYTYGVEYNIKIDYSESGYFYLIIDSVSYGPYITLMENFDTLNFSCSSNSITYEAYVEFLEITQSSGPGSFLSYFAIPLSNQKFINFNLDVDLENIDYFYGMVVDIPLDYYRFELGGVNGTIGIDCMSDGFYIFEEIDSYFVSSKIEVDNIYSNIEVAFGFVPTFISGNLSSISVIVRINNFVMYEYELQSDLTDMVNFYGGIFYSSYLDIKSFVKNYNPYGQATNTEFKIKGFAVFEEIIIDNETLAIFPYEEIKRFAYIVEENEFDLPFPVNASIQILTLNLYRFDYDYESSCDFVDSFLNIRMNFVLADIRFNNQSKSGSISFSYSYYNLSSNDTLYDFYRFDRDYKITTDEDWWLYGYIGDSFNYTIEYTVYYWYFYDIAPEELLEFVISLFAPVILLVIFPLALYLPFRKYGACAGFLLSIIVNYVIGFMELPITIVLFVIGIILFYVVWKVDRRGVI